MYETIRRATTRLAEGVLKWVGITALVVSCALLVYMGALLLARLAAWIIFP